MAIRDDGGPAFPSEEVVDGRGQSEGMTLRDWLAGRFFTKAYDEMGHHSNYELLHMGFASLEDAAAGTAYSWADAMIEARNQ